MGPFKSEPPSPSWTNLCLYSPINVKTAGAIGTNFFEATYMTPGEGLWMLPGKKSQFATLIILENPQKRFTEKNARATINS